LWAARFGKEAPVKLNAPSLTARVPTRSALLQRALLQRALPQQVRTGRGPSAAASAAVLALALVGLLIQSGCQKTVLRPDDVRSPYDRYERVRAERAEPYLEDEFGRRTPNLRGRLLERSE
jgi:hypothetical protein